MSKEITLNISERFAAAKLINDYKGTTIGLALMLEGIKQIAITEEDWKLAGLTKNPSDEEIQALPADQKSTAMQTLHWNDTPESDKTITLDGEVVKYLLDSINKLEADNAITIADKALITLKAKLQ